MLLTLGLLAGCSSEEAGDGGSFSSFAGGTLDGGTFTQEEIKALLRSRLSATSSPGAEAAVDHSFSSCTQSRFSSSSVQSSGACSAIPAAPKCPTWPPMPRPCRTTYS